MDFGHEGLRGSRILVVDDEPTNLRVLEKLLGRAGYRDVLTISDPSEAIRSWRDFAPDLLLLDLHMPGLDGFAVLNLLAEEIPKDQYFPVLVLTGDLSREVMERALIAGARDFITKPFDVTEVLLRIRNLLETRALHLALQAHNENLEDRVRARTQELAEAQIEILHRLALASEYRDDITGRHAERVGLMSALLAEEIGVVEDQRALLRRAATLHDVGKIGVPDAILRKPGPLTPDEVALMRSHTEIGARILSGSRFPLLQMAREVAQSHHEKWDGTGYTPGVRGEAIPLVARIVAVADVFDSLTHERPYKGSSTLEEATALIRAASGSHFDPDVVRAFERLVERDEVSGLDERVQFSVTKEAEAIGLPS
jgi:putative two-component system response regulator